MYQLFTPAKSITIQEYKRFCQSRRFSSVLPNELVGIIHRDEFKQSIDRINRARKGPFCMRTARYGLFVILLLGLLTLIVGLGLIWIPNKTVWIILISAGGGVFISMMILLCVCFCCTPLNHRPLPDAVNAESMKYSTRIPIPTRWRLNMSIIPENSIYVDWQYQVIYSLIIDIGKRVNSKFRSDTSKSNSFKPTSHIDRSYPASPSPSSTMIHLGISNL